MESPLEKLAFLSLLFLLLAPNLCARSQPNNNSYTGHMGHYLYFVISAPIETKVGQEVKIMVEVLSTYDIVLTSYRLRVYGAGTNKQSSEVNTSLPQGTGIPKTITVTPTSEDTVYIEVRAEYDWQTGGQHQQGYGDLTVPITTARAETLDELKQQNQQFSSLYSNYTKLEGQYLEVSSSLQDAQSKLGNLTTSYDVLRGAYEQLQSENLVMQANYGDVLNQLQIQSARATNYEYIAISSIAAAIIILIAAVVTRRRGGRASGQPSSRKT